jgi:hypothetical protein
MSDARKPPVDGSALLRDAVLKPGVISKAYRLFWNYSAGYQLLTLFDCFRLRISFWRGMAPICLPSILVAVAPQHVYFAKLD